MRKINYQLFIVVLVFLFFAVQPPTALGKEYLDQTEVKRLATKHKPTQSVKFDESSKSLASIMNADGTLRLGDGVSGSFDTQGCRLVSEAWEGPRFIEIDGQQVTDEERVKIQASGDEYWDDQFGVNGVNSAVYALAVSGTDVYVGGEFTTAGGVAANYIARWDGSSWHALGSGTDHVVNALAVSGTDVYAGGFFTTAGGVTVNSIARWDGSSWHALGSGLGVAGLVFALAVNGTDVYVGGDFTTAGGLTVNNIMRWDGSSWHALGDGVSSGYYVSSVYALAVSGTDIYVGGNFATAGGVTVNSIARWDGSTWHALGSGTDSWVKALAVSGTDVYVGGFFTTAGGVAANYIARWDGSSWHALGSGIISYQAYVNALAVSGTDVYVGGYFTTAGGVTANHIARWDGSSWHALGSGTNKHVDVLAVNGMDVYVGGVFSTAGGKWSECFGHWNPSASITVTSPNGGETWIAGSTSTVTWTSTGIVSHVDIDLATNGGSNWGSLKTNILNDGTELVTVPSTPSTQCRIRVKESSTSTPSNISDDNFTILLHPSITVTSPNGGENWLVGSTQNINWYGAGTVGDVKIEYSSNNGSSWNTITPSTSNDGSEPWIVPNDISSQCLVKISELDGYPTDTSDSVFSIVATPTLTVTSPNGGEIWWTGTTQNISWIQSGLTGTVAIDLYKGGTFHSSIGAAMATAESFSWNIPLGHLVGSDYKVRIYQGSLEDYSDDNFSITVLSEETDDLLGTWSTGVWYRNSGTGSWIRMTTPANLIAAGDLDGDGVSDLVGVWSSGLWVKYSSTASWKKLSDIPLPTSIACGDVNGDGRDDIVGSWPMGTFYRDTLGEIWVYISSPADALAAGDLDGDGTDDLIGVWDDGLWVKYSSTGLWEKLDKHPPADIACGDLNGDGKDDVLGTWSVYGTFYLDTPGGSWVYMSTPAVLVGTGDLDGDGICDLIGTWSGAHLGLWVKYSVTMRWKKISLSIPSDLDAGMYRGGAWDMDAQRFMNILEALGAYGTEDPGSLSEYEDISEKGPGGWNFVYKEELNLVPHVSEAEELRRISGPGEPGFTWIEQKNLVPKETLESKEKKKE